MTQTYRTDDFARWGAGQGFNLSPAQVDNNFWDLIQRMIAQEVRPDPSAGIAYFEIVGVMMYVHMTDDTVLGPYELPVAIFRDRGAWMPGMSYSKMDTFSINGGLYVVIFDHTSGTSFDPGANDGAGHDYYQLMIQTPGSSLPSGGAVGQLLKKTTTADYAVGWGNANAGTVDFEPATGSPLTSFNVADALEEVALYGDALNVSYEPSTASGLTSTNVQDAIEELASGSGGGGGGVGKQTIWVPAVAMTPRTSNGPSVGTVEMATFKNMVQTLDFDSSTAEYAQFDIAMPKSWDGGDLVFKLFWSHASTTTNFGVTFVFDMVSIPNGNALDNSFDNLASVTDTGGTANTMYVSSETTPENLFSTYGDMIMFRVSRNPADAGDTLAIDARVHGIQLFYTTAAATDD